MENFPINPLDLAVVAVVLLAALLALTRGLVAEVLSLGSWVAASLVALYALPHVLPITRNYIHFEMLAYGLTAVGLFIVGLVMFTMIASGLSRRVQNSALSAIDRSLGFAFGLFKGAVLASLAWLFVVWLVPPGEQPTWMKEARTRPLLNSGAGTIYELVPENLRAEGLAHVDFARERAQQAIDAKQALDRLTSPVPTAGTNAAASAAASANNSGANAAAPAATGVAGGGTGGSGKTDAPAAQNGYNDRDRGSLDRLIQTNR